MSEETAIQKSETSGQREQALQSVGAEQVRRQVNEIQEIMQAVMDEGTHYGSIPGTGDRKTLLKAGAEKLGHAFRLSPQYDIERTDLGDGHREYEIVCHLIHINSGKEVGQGVGLCSTKESKYRYRYQETSTGVAVPKDYWDDRTPEKLRETADVEEDVSVGTSKIDGQWVIVTKRKAENPDIADTYNTVLKMAKKRAHVDAVLTGTAASDIFTQDVEDFVDVGGEEVSVSTGEVKSASNSSPAEASKKQLGYIGALKEEKGISREFLQDLAANVCGKRSARDLTKDEASNLIEALQELPDPEDEQTEEMDFEEAGDELPFDEPEDEDFEEPPAEFASDEEELPY